VPDIGAFVQFQRAGLVPGFFFVFWYRDQLTSPGVKGIRISAGEGAETGFKPLSNLVR
jgi:hypothetical protein